MAPAPLVAPQPRQNATAMPDPGKDTRRAGAEWPSLALRVPSRRRGWHAPVSPGRRARMANAPGLHGRSTGPSAYSALWG